MKLQVIACDIDQKFPAKTYTITASDGRSISKDLCEEHAEPFEEWLEEAQEVTVLREAKPAPAPAPAPAAKPTAQKSAAKKTAPARRRPKITSLAEIEASKKA